ncbi:unnamed protein product [Brachionus calyciflorus]|uniref:Uncharacterized protein n=1 Tax=Brachionus calyciflorus TaxID=104777 RepID=A0A814KIJ6_9BILA|nr:unnamed protein product [Brachionus calyciflorus]
MHGCKRSKIQNYIDEFIWRYNNNCDRKECFNLILKDIARFFSPGQTVENFELMLRAVNGDPEEDLELLSDCSDSESGSKSDTESVKGFLVSDKQRNDSNLAVLDANKEKFDDDELTLSLNQAQ